jgi:hypothetical protein
VETTPELLRAKDQRWEIWTKRAEDRGITSARAWLRGERSGEVSEARLDEPIQAVIASSNSFDRCYIQEHDNCLVVTDYNRELGLIPWLNGEGRQSAYQGDVWCEKNLD